MTFIGHYTETYAKVLFVIFAILSSGTFATHIYYLKNLDFFAVALLPFLSFCISYENVALYYGDSINPHSVTANIAYVLHSLQIPLFCIAEYELCFRLFEARSAHFCCVRFDQGTDISSAPAFLSLWSMRILSAGLFVMNILVAFDFLDSNSFAGRGGYIALASNRTSISMWLHLIPPIVLSALSIYISLVLYR